MPARLVILAGVVLAGLGFSPVFAQGPERINDPVSAAAHRARGACLTKQTYFAGSATIETGSPPHGAHRETVVINPVGAIC